MINNCAKVPTLNWHERGLNGSYNYDMDKLSAMDVKKALALGVLDVHKVKQDYYEFTANSAERFHMDTEEYSIRVKEQRDTRKKAMEIMGDIINNRDLLQRIADVLNGDYVQDKIV